MGTMLADPGIWARVDLQQRLATPPLSVTLMMASCLGISFMRVARLRLCSGFFMIPPCTSLYKSMDHTPHCISCSASWTHLQHIIIQGRR